MLAHREFPANPFILVYHVPVELTRAVVEGYSPASSRQPPLAAALLAIPGVRGVQYFRHELWVRRAPEAAWHTLLPAIEAALRRHLGPVDIREYTGDRRYLSLEAPWLQVPKPMVFEGVEAAAAHPLARALFAVPGVVEVLLKPGSLRIRKGGAFRWEAMQDRIRAAVEAFRRHRRPAPAEQGPDSRTP
jgi:hypothetical protein